MIEWTKDYQRYLKWMLWHGCFKYFEYIDLELSQEEVDSMMFTYWWNVIR